jgi:hypothetical protein
MKKIKLFSVLGAIMVLGLSNCNINAQFGKKGSGTITEQERNVPVFTGIEAGGGIDVYVTQGEKQKVVVVTDDNLQEYVKTKVEGDILKIYLDKWSIHAKSMKVKITLKDLKSVSCSGGSDFYTESPVVVGNLSVSLSGGSDAKIELKAIEIMASASGGSDLYLKGAAGLLKVEASGGSGCKAYELTVAKADASASGGSDIFLTVDKELKAEASGGSDVHYKGNAAIVKSESSGGSDIIKE